MGDPSKWPLAEDGRRNRQITYVASVHASALCTYIFSHDNLKIHYLILKTKGYFRRELYAYY